MTYPILTGVAKPQAKKAVAVAKEKYPANKLAVGDFFVVPKSEKKPEETDAKFRNRVHNAIRSYRLRANKERTLEADYNPQTFEPLEFSTILLGEPEENQPWQAGDVGVWRDA